MRIVLASVALTTLTACGVSGSGGDEQGAGTTPAATKPAPVEKKARTLMLGAYTTPREPYGKAIIPAFQKKWLADKGETLTFQESYLGSGAQARAIVGGFEADVAALSLQADIEKITKAELITGDWKAGAHRGMVTRSIVVIGVRPGNPKGVKDWGDLAKPGLQVLTPNVRTSGGAMWNILAIYGAALRDKVPGVAAGDAAAAEKLLAGVLANVRIMDKGARESMLTFEQGIGDAIITYENEILAARKSGQAYDIVIPTSTILIENPVAVVDKYAASHGNTELARAFVEFLGTREAQLAFAEWGYRPVDETVAKEVATRFPTVTDLFTVRDLGDWPQVQTDVFADGAFYDRALARREQK